MLKVVSYALCVIVTTTWPGDLIFFYPKWETAYYKEKEMKEEGKKGIKEERKEGGKFFLNIEKVVISQNVNPLSSDSYVFSTLTLPS